MADKKITELPELSAPNKEDLLAIVDDPQGTPETKKISLKNTLFFGHENFIKNGNFINNSTNGYGATPDNWTSANANPVQGGFPEFTKQQLIDLLGISDGDIQGLWNLNELSGNAIDLSSNGYDLTDINTVGSSSDGLMATARDFVRANSEYFTHPAPNIASLTGSQTWIVFAKPNTLANYQKIMGRQAAGGGISRGFDIQTSGQTYFYMEGLTTNGYVSPEFFLEPNKWYMLVGIYDSNNSKLKYWVNGIKTEVTASGSPAAITSDFSIGRFGSRAIPQEYFDGLIQGAAVLSVALTDEQVKRLWAFTTYKGQKIRRSTTDALLYQDLDACLVERLRGKSLTLRASVYASSTNHRIYIYDGTTTTVAYPTAANIWEDIDVTATISDTAKQIRVGIEAATTDGSMWVKEVALYEGSIARPFTPSIDDITRFPRLLKQDVPRMKNGYPYQYEENRWHTHAAPTVTPQSGFTISGVTNYYKKFKFAGKTCTWNLAFYGTAGGNAKNYIDITPPIILASTEAGNANQAKFFSSAWVSGNAYAISGTAVRVNRYDGGNLPNSGTLHVALKMEYEID